MGFLCVEPMPIHTVAPAFRSAAARTVKSANSPAPDGRSLASLFSALRGCATAQSCLKSIPFHRRLKELEKAIVAEPAPTPLRQTGLFSSSHYPPATRQPIPIRIILLNQMLDA